MEVFSAALFLPVTVVLLELDPYYHIFELFLPSRYKQGIIVIFVVFWIRLIIFTIRLAEFLRFNCMILFLTLSLTFTLTTCLKKVISQETFTERTTLKLYTQLRLIMLMSETIIHLVLPLAMIFVQILITVTKWFVLTCRYILPFYLTYLAILLLVVTILVSVMTLNLGVQISEGSQRFILQKRALYFSFNRNKAKYYYFSRWRSERWLPVRFYLQLNLNQESVMNYYEVIIDGIFNAVLLINP